MSTGVLLRGALRLRLDLEMFSNFLKPEVYIQNIYNCSICLPEHTLCSRSAGDDPVIASV